MSNETGQDDPKEVVSKVRPQLLVGPRQQILLLLITQNMNDPSYFYFYILYVGELMRHTIERSTC